MKLSCKLTMLAASLLSVTSCSDSVEDKRITQCKAIAEHYSPVIAYQAVGYDGSIVELKLTVKSAIKNLDGHVSCTYSDVSALPTMVMIGKTKHIDQVDIQSLADGKYLDGKGFPEHSH